MKVCVYQDKAFTHIRDRAGLIASTAVHWLTQKLELKGMPGWGRLKFLASVVRVGGRLCQAGLQYPPNERAEIWGRFCREVVSFFLWDCTKCWLAWRADGGDGLSQDGPDNTPERNSTQQLGLGGGWARMRGGARIQHPLAHTKARTKGRPMPRRAAAAPVST